MDVSEQSFLMTCRTCLCVSPETQSVFLKSDKVPNEDLHLSDMIMSFSSVEISDSDGLPQVICANCANQVVEFYLFKLKCEETDRKVRTMLEHYTQSSQSCAEDNMLQGVDGVDEEDEVDEDCKKPICKAEPIEEVPYQHRCNLCPRVFNNYRALESHEFLHSLKDSQVLTDGKVKGKRLKKEEALDDDTKWIKSEGEVLMPKVSSEKLQCLRCDKFFAGQKYLKRHLMRHLTQKEYVCGTCNIAFLRQEQLTFHQTIHTGTKPHTCSVCGKGFGQLSNLRDHMRTHNGEKPFLCPTCGKGFNQLGNLRQHTVRHSGVKAHLCATCGTAFASKGELLTHLRRHTGARPYVCNECQHGFTTSSSLTKHKRVHSGEKPYKCETCSMNFSRSGTLRRHIRIHTGEKPYACEHCDKAFAQSNDLTSHLRIHTGERPYVCDVCGQQFRQNSALNTHKKMHNDRKQRSQLQPLLSPPPPSDQIKVEYPVFLSQTTKLYANIESHII